MQCVHHASMCKSQAKEELQSLETYLIYRVRSVRWWSFFGVSLRFRIVAIAQSWFHWQLEVQIHPETSNFAGIQCFCRFLTILESHLHFSCIICIAQAVHRSPLNQWPRRSLLRMQTQSLLMHRLATCVQTQQVAVPLYDIGSVPTSDSLKTRP